jgi:hypothetical protein
MGLGARLWPKRCRGSTSSVFLGKLAVVYTKTLHRETSLSCSRVLPAGHRDVRTSMTYNHVRAIVRRAWPALNDGRGSGAVCVNPTNSAVYGARSWVTCRSPLGPQIDAETADFSTV